MTIALGLKLVKAFCGKGIDKRILHQVFATPERKADNRTKDLSRVEELFRQYQEAYEGFLKDELKELAELTKKKRF